jgi:hypothetical protein
MKAFGEIAIVLTFGFLQTTSPKPPTQGHVSKVFDCVIRGCAVWDSYKQLDSHNFQAEFTYNQKHYRVFGETPLRDNSPSRLDFELQADGASNVQSLESFGCSLDGIVPFKDSSSPYGFSGRRPDYLAPPFFKDEQEYWQNRFNEAIADALAFIASHRK